MKAALFIVAWLLIMGGAATGAWYAVASIQVSGILPSNWLAADVIRERCPVHLVSPDWIKGSDQASILFAWAATELRVRLIVVCTLWFLALAGLFRRASLSKAA